MWRLILTLLLAFRGLGANAPPDSGSRFTCA